MEVELRSFIKVCAWTAASMTYARFAALRLPPGTSRRLALLPVLLILAALPWSFSTAHFRGIFAFSLTWLGSFKILLLSSGLPPLSPSLTLPTFIAAASLPVKLRPQRRRLHNRPHLISLTAILRTSIRMALLSATIRLYPYCSYLHPFFTILIINYAHLYLALDLIFAVANFLPGTILGHDLEPHFDNPFVSSSLSDFWGRRWNLMVTAVFRPSVYLPVLARFGSAAAVMATFFVSGLMHEVFFYYLAHVRPTGEVTCFFLIHGVCVLAEGRARRAGWRPLHPVVAVPVTLGFVGVTVYWLFWQPLWRDGAVEMIVRESLDAMGMFEAVVGRVWSLLMNQTEESVLVR